MAVQWNRPDRALLKGVRWEETHISVLPGPWGKPLPVRTRRWGLLIGRAPGTPFLATTTICLQSWQSAPDSSIRQLARAWDVTHATFRRRILSIVKGSGHKSGRNTVLPYTTEKELANTITGLARLGFPLTREEVYTLAFEFAEKNGLKGFSNKKQQAGYY